MTASGNAVDSDILPAMSKKSIILVALLLISLVIIYFLWPSDEARIRRLFREGATAVEEEKIDVVMAKVSFNYSDDSGLTYLILKDAFGRFFKQMDHIKIEYGITAIRVDDAKAVAEVDVRVVASSGTDTGYVVGDAGTAARMTFYLEKERSRWLVTKTEGMQKVMGGQ